MIDGPGSWPAISGSGFRWERVIKRWKPLVFRPRPEHHRAVAPRPRGSASEQHDAREYGWRAARDNVAIRRAPCRQRATVASI